nr:unnamed protein product [Digitaria exilis]
MPPPRPYLLLPLFLLLAFAICSTAQTTEPLPPPPPPGAPRPPHRHRHVAPTGAPLTPPPPSSGLPSPPPPPRRRHAPATPTPVAAVPPAPAQAPPPTPAPPVVTSPTPKYPSSSANPSTDPYPFTNNPFFPTVTPPPPPPAAETQPSSSGDGGLPTFPANISTLVAPTPRASGSHRFPVLQALLLSLLSLCLLLLSALLSIHLVRRLRHHGRSRAAASTAAAGNRRAATVASSDDGDSDDKDVRKSRPLHSDKLKPSSLHMKDEVIQLYLNNSAAVAAPREVCLLGAARCHGIGMVVGALGVSREQLRDALLEGNAHGLGVEALRMLTQVVLSNEEELKLKYFKDDSLARLCPVEAFVKAMLDVPFAFKRVDAMLYIASFYLEVNQLRLSYATLEGACQEMRSSRLFHKVVEAVMNFGNFMRINAGSPSSHGLEPNTVLKIVDVKGADGKAALVQFVVQEILKPEVYDAKCSMVQGDAGCRKHGLEVVSKLAAELSNMKKAASVDVAMLNRSVSELGMGLGKVHDVMRLNSMVTSADSARPFHNSMSTFLKQAEEDILKLQSQESVCLSSVKEMAEYFHGDSVNDEARMLRVFAGVREFLAMLDRICKEAGEISDNSWLGSTTASWTAAPMGMTP